MGYNSDLGVRRGIKFWFRGKQVPKGWEKILYKPEWFFDATYRWKIGLVKLDLIRLDYRLDTIRLG